MRRLILGFAGRTYHIVGNLMHWLKCKKPGAEDGSGVDWQMMYVQAMQMLQFDQPRLIMKTFTHVTFILIIVISCALMCFHGSNSSCFH